MISKAILLVVQKKEPNLPVSPSLKLQRSKAGRQGKAHHPDSYRDQLKSHWQNGGIYYAPKLPGVWQI